jgi:hypothetical protein
MIKGIRPKLAEAGKIKIGGLGPERKSKKGGTYRLPQKYDYFLITGTNRDEKGDLEQDTQLMEAIGTDASDGQIREIPIVLHSDEIDEVFPTTYAMYSGRRCACRGDGQTATRREIKKDKYTGAEKTINCPCNYLRSDSQPTCKPNGKLFCSISAPGASVAGAVHIWRTTSIISIEQMIGSLMQIKSICGTLRGIPLWLRVKPITVEPEGQGPITVYCCHVELRAADVAQIQRQALEAADLRQRLGWSDDEYKGVLSLPAHGETDEEQEAIAAEFYAEDVSNTGAPNTGAHGTVATSTTGRGTSPAEITTKLETKPETEAEPEQTELPGDPI